MRDNLFERLQKSYIEKRKQIRSRLREFKDILKKGDDLKIFEELAFCIFTAGASAKMGLKSVDSIRDVIMSADEYDLSKRLKGIHRFPNARAKYVFYTREFLKKEYDFRLKDLILFNKDPQNRRDFFASYKGIMGMGYKEASHFLRNIGFTGYAILDKHILRSLHELKITNSSNPPTSRKSYLSIEKKLKKFASHLDIDFDELDLLLWSERTGEILK